MNPEISVSYDITLVTLHNVPSDIVFITKVFDRISKMNIDVDMISLSPPYSFSTDLSFTVKDDDLPAILSDASEFSHHQIKMSVSSGNCKISVNDPAMEHHPGAAAAIFHQYAQLHTDIRLITTSESQVSILIPKADFDSICNKIKKE